MDLEELINGLRALRPREHIEGPLATGIVHNHKSLKRDFPIGPSYKLETFLGEHHTQGNSVVIQTISEFRAFFKLQRYICSWPMSMASAIFDALFVNEGWAEKYDEYLLERIDEIDSPYYLYIPSKSDIDVTHWKCQLEYWKRAIIGHGYSEGDSDGLFDDLKNPHLLGLLYDINSGKRNQDRSSYDVQFGLLKHRIGPLPNLEDAPHRKLYEELIHGRTEYFQEVIAYLNLTENWPEFRRNNLLSMIQKSMENPSAPLHTIIMTQFEKSQQSASEYVVGVLQSNILWRSECRTFFTQNLLKMIDLVAICQRGLGIPELLKFSPWPLFRKIIRQAPMESIARSYAKFLADSSNSRMLDDLDERQPFAYFGLERAGKLLRLGAFVYVKSASLELIDDSNDVNLVMRSINSEKLPHLKALVSAVVSGRIPEIALPMIQEMGSKVAPVPFHIPFSLIDILQQSGTDDLKLLQTIPKSMYTNDGAVKIFVDWKLWSLARCGRLKPDDLKLLAITAKNK